MSEPRGPDYKLLDAIGTGTVKEIAERVREAAQAVIPGYTIEEATAFTYHAAGIAEKREKAIETLKKFKGKKVRRTKKNERLLANLEKWGREADRYSFLKPAGKNFAGVKVYTGATRRPKLHIHTEEDCKEGSWHQMFWQLTGPNGQYFFQSQLIAYMEEVMDQHGVFVKEDGTQMSAGERADKVRKVWDIGRRGKEKRGFFNKKEFEEFIDPVWYAIGTEEPKWTDVENIPMPEPELTELQAKHKNDFQDFQGFAWRHEVGLSWDLYEPSSDPFVRHLIDGEHVHDGEDSKGNYLSAEEWALRMIGFAQDVDDPRKKALYYDNDPKSKTYKALCYAGWIPEADNEKWSSLPRCVLGSYKFRQLAQQIGPYSVVGKVRSGSAKSHPMYGCNSMWQAETAVKLGLCNLTDGEIVGVNTLQAEREKWKAEQERKLAEAQAKEAERKAKELEELKKKAVNCVSSSLTWLEWLVQPKREAIHKITADLVEPDGCIDRNKFWQAVYDSTNLHPTNVQDVVDHLEDCAKRDERLKFKDHELSEEQKLNKDRMDKCNALADKTVENGCTEAEAAAAAEKLEELLDKYGINKKFFWWMREQQWMQSRSSHQLKDSAAA